MPPGVCWAIFWRSETIWSMLASPWMWIVSCPVHALVALVRDVRQPGLGVDPELLEDRGGALVALPGLGLPGRLLVGRLELLEDRRAHLVRLPLVLDVGVVLGGDQPAVEAEALTRPGGADLGGQVELGERSRVARVALERPVDRRRQASRLSALGGAVEADVEVAAGDLGGVVEGLVEDLVRVLAATASSPASAARQRGRKDGDRAR